MDIKIIKNSKTEFNGLINGVKFYFLYPEIDSEEDFTEIIFEKDEIQYSHFISEYDEWQVCPEDEDLDYDYFDEFSSYWNTIIKAIAKSKIGEIMKNNDQFLYEK